MLDPAAPASEADDSALGEGGMATRVEPRRTLPRTARPLPTDRLKFETQVEALKALAISSDFGSRSVAPEDMAPMMSVAATTAGLNNAFFIDSGLATREGRGRYKPTETANLFARKHSFDAKEAGKVLRESLAETWYFAAVKQRLTMGTATRPQMIETLAHAANATKERQVQLSNLLDWLDYAGLIDASGANISLLGGDDAATTDATNGGLADDEEQTKPPGSSIKGAQTPADSASARSTTSPGRSERQGDAVLAFSFDFALTGDELAKLSPDQIKSLFESVGTVMALKAAVT